MSSSSENVEGARKTAKPAEALIQEVYARWNELTRGGSGKPPPRVHRKIWMEIPDIVSAASNEARGSGQCRKRWNSLVALAKVPQHRCAGLNLNLHLQVVLTTGGEEEEDDTTEPEEEEVETEEDAPCIPLPLQESPVQPAAITSASLTEEAARPSEH